MFCLYHFWAWIHSVIPRNRVQGLSRSLKINHTVNSGSEMVGAKHVSGKNIYWSTCIGKSKERKIFDFLHCPFEPPAKQHRPVSQLGWILWCMLAQPSKGQFRNSRNLAVKVDQNIFFPEACFASTISKPEFTVCAGRFKTENFWLFKRNVQIHL